MRERGRSNRDRVSSAIYKFRWWLLIALLLAGTTIALQYVVSFSNDQNIAVARVQSIVAEEAQPGIINDAQRVTQTVTLTFNTGPLAGQQVTTTHAYETAGPYIFIGPLQQNDWVVTQINLKTLTGEPLVIVVTRLFLLPLIPLLALFLGIIILVGQKKGFLTLISLVISGLLLFGAVIPLVTKAGWNPISAILVIAVPMTVIDVLVVVGWNKKSLAASIGMLTAVFITFLLSTGFAALMKVPGELANEDASLYYQMPEITAVSVFLAGILLGAIGAVNDIAVSIAAAVQEVKYVKPSATIEELWSSGMRVGRDIIGTMTNTLIFAYVGTSLVVWLSYGQGDYSPFLALNVASVSEELLRSLSSTIGLAVAVPVTAWASAYLYTKKKIAPKESSST